MKAFDLCDLGENLKELDNDETVHRSLGLCWNLKDDTFRFSVPEGETPFTRRGLLSTVNSLFDPMGFIAPIILSGKILLREVTQNAAGWDEPLPTAYEQKWREWISSLHILKDVSIPRMLSHQSVSLAKNVEVHIFSDASENEIAASAYLKVTDSDCHTSVRFLMGKGKLAPARGHTIPRLELCAAVLATEIAEIISIQLDIPLTSMYYYSDSRVVLGYISNQTRRFSNYVSNRVDQILKVSTADQWSYISKDKNPADSCTRSIFSIPDVMRLPWIHGPQWLCDTMKTNTDSMCYMYPLIEPECDVEVRPLSTNISVESKVSGLGAERFQRFSNWKNLICAVMCLQRFVKMYKTQTKSQRDYEISYSDAIQKAEHLVLKELEQEHFQKDIKLLSEKKSLTKDSRISLMKMDSFV